MEDQFFHLKNMYGSKLRTFYCCLVVISYFEEFGKSTLKSGPRFKVFLKIFYKKVKVLTLSYTLLHFVLVFKEIEEKFAQI